MIRKQTRAAINTANLNVIDVSDEPSSIVVEEKPKRQHRKKSKKAKVKRKR